MKKIVLLTGGTGYVGSWIAKILLEKGFTVRLAVRDKSKTFKYDFLQTIAEKTKGQLEIWEADLLQPGSYDEAAKGSDCLIHSASPFTLSVKDPQQELVNPALNGTINVLNAATQSKTIQKVVLTSSIAAVHGDNIDLKELQIEVLNETHFNVTSSLDHQPYSYSKVVAEKKAWELYEMQKQWELCVINPGFVMGPPLIKNSNSGSIDFMKNILTGKYRSGAPNLDFGFVDVRDIANAHVKAVDNTDIKGRFIVVNEIENVYAFALRIKKLFGNKYKLPMMKAPKFLVQLSAPLFGLTRKFVKRNIGYPLKVDNSKSKNSLGIKYIPLDTSIQDMIEKMEELKMF